MVRGLDDAERRPVLAAGERPGVAVGQDPQRPVVRASGSTVQPERRQPAVVVVASNDDRVGLVAHRVGDRVAVLGQLADRLVAGHHPVHRPAQVDGRRPGVDAARSRRPGASPGARTAGRRACCSAVSASPIAATWPIAGAPRTIISRMAYAASPADVTRVLDERVGQLALVDEVAATPPSSRNGVRNPVGRRSATLDGVGRRRAPRRRAAPGPGSRSAASADARWSACAAPTTVAAACDAARRRTPEEPPAAEVGAGGRLAVGSRPARSVAVGRRRAARVGRRARRARSAARQYLMTLVTRRRRAGRGP